MRRLQQEIIDALKVKPTIDVDAEIKRSINFMQSYLQKNRVTNAGPGYLRRTRFYVSWKTGPNGNH